MPRGEDVYEEDDPLERTLALMRDACDDEYAELECALLLESTEGLATQADFEERYARMQESEL